ncbi:sensor histidine kinase [Lunatibacter salilacus]|uniref:sensor histidine kinase n=1 Tax=Lunatibacter salilacus TaxID=2483804 RepID=UPI00131CFE95|nr:tetratricopeptide repeat protein [Lunatibacter salilacus]
MKKNKQFPQAIDIYYQLMTEPGWINELSNARKTFNSMAFSYYMLQQFDSSARYYLKSNQVAIQLKDTSQIIISYKSLAMAYRQIGLYAKSLENSQNALSLAEFRNDQEQMSDILNTMSIMYLNLNQYDKALEKQRMALNLARSLHDSLGIAYLYNNIAMSHFYTARYDSSLYFNLKALEIKTALGLPKTDQVANLSNIGEDYLKMGDLKMAERYLSEAHRLYLENSDIEGQIICEETLVDLAIKKNDFRTANKYLDSIKHLFDIVFVKDLYLKYLELRVLLAEEEGKFEEAFVFHKELAVLKEEVFQEELLDVQQVESEYLLREKELEKSYAEQEAQFARDENKRYILFITVLFVTVLVTLLLAYLLFRFNKTLKVKNGIIESQKADLTHRTYNVLMKVQSLLRLASGNLEDEKSKQVMQNLEAAVLSAASIQQQLTVEGESTEIQIGAYIQALVKRLEEMFELTGHRIKFEVIFKEENKLPTTTVLNLGIIIAELITNATKHAFTEEIINPQITVTIEKQGAKLLVNVQDNGIGVNGSQKQGTGTGLVQRLAKYIQADLFVKSDHGTSYTLRLNTYE